MQGFAYEAPAAPGAVYLNVAQAADRAGLTQNAVRKAISRGDLAAESVYPFQRITVADYEQWRATRRGPGYRIRKPPLPEPPPTVEHGLALRGYLGNGWQHKCLCGWMGTREDFGKHIAATIRAKEKS